MSLVYAPVALGELLKRASRSAKIDPLAKYCGGKASFDGGLLAGLSFRTVVAFWPLPVSLFSLVLMLATERTALSLQTWMVRSSRMTSRCSNSTYRGLSQNTYSGLGVRAALSNCA
jgi:hypothetical protein